MFSTAFFALSAIIFLFEPRVSMATEPVCSKFSYEEKLLEKMIRTEIKVETMQNEIKNTEETVLNTLLDIEKTAAENQNKIDDFRNNLTGEIGTQFEELQEKEELFEVKFEELKNNFKKEMKNEVNILAETKKTILQPTVTFLAHDVKDLILDRTHEILVFQKVIANEGSGYNNATGVFTASIEGVYLFTVHVCASYKKYSTIGLALDGTFVSKSINYNSQGYSCGSVSAIVPMENGRQVWVASTYGSTGHVLAGEDTYVMNTFSGVLISK
ncbi:uncharacterized protein LOC132757532 [Ruditapes philippinarum]|uniref:uncharacterized protein LOC132757532 n=1 Tax=Ruditapes philippinarum TaxID=129788 RepID=UPI00295A6525|nr:uncharacterized protein LOC132757532 [Ruditapes philippinarum]